MKTLIHWPNLDFYGLRLQQVFVGDRAYIACTGEIDRYEEQLDSLGFRPHKSQPLFVRSVSRDRPLRVETIRRVFPSLRVEEVERDAIQLRLRQDTSTATRDAPPDAPAPSGQAFLALTQRNPRSAAAVRLLDGAGLLPRLSASPDSFFAAIAGTATDGFEDVSVESHAADGGRHEIILTALATIGDDRIEVTFERGADGELAHLHTLSSDLMPVSECEWLDDACARISRTQPVEPNVSEPTDNQGDAHDNDSDDSTATSTDAGGLSGGGHGSGDSADERTTGTTGELDGEAPTHPAGNDGGAGDRASTEPPEAPHDDSDTTGAGSNNYKLTDTSLLQPGSYRRNEVLQKNLAAMRRLAEVDESRTARWQGVSQDDGDAMIQYAGWGGLPELFTPNTPMANGYRSHFDELVASKSEVDEAAASTLNAHYTSAEIIQQMWRGVGTMGFDGGVALEPGAGVGLFIACQPSESRDDTRWITVEKDGISNRLLRALYPDGVHLGAYESAPVADNSVDLVIGNVPFGNYKVHDPAYRKAGLSIHDQFIVKSLDKLRPGGVMAVITSHWTLDKTAARARSMMHERGDLLAAARLPEDAFTANAGTTVTTDLLVFRKRLPNEEPQPFDWEGGVEITGRDNETQHVNAIFKTERGQFLGHPVRSSGRFGPTNAVVRRDPRTGEMADISALVAKIADMMPAGAYTPRQDAIAAGWSAAASAGAAILDHAQEDANHALLDAFAPNAEGCFVLADDGDIGEIFGGEFRALDFANKKAESRVRGMIGVRDALTDVMRVQLSRHADGGAFDARLGDLNKSYDKFVAAFGPLSSSANRRLFADDPYADLLLAVENYDRATDTATKADVFRERTLPVPAEQRDVKAATAQEALLVSLQSTARVDGQLMAGLLNMPWREIREELRDEVFLDPESGHFEPAARFLSGNVRRRAVVLEAAIDNESDPSRKAEFQHSLEHVKRAIPLDITQDEIDASLGVTWIDVEDIEAFVRHLHGGEKHSICKVEMAEATADWKVSVSSPGAAAQWGTDRLTAAKIVEASLKGQPAKVMDREPDSNRYYVNQTATAAALERQRAIEGEFRAWLWSDVDRAERLTKKYNELFNSSRAPDYRNLRFDVSGRNPTLSFRAEQSSAITRIVMEQDTLLAHPVGFGKTATMAGAAMKLRELGMARKPMIVARKNTLHQTAAEIVRWFPKARPLVVQSPDLNPKGRAAFWRRVQTRNPDVIVVTPEAFKRIPLSREDQIEYLDKEMTELKSALEGGDLGDGGDGQFKRSRKDIEKRLASAKAKLQELLNESEKDDGNVTFGTLGIDALFVDEAQNYKNLQVITRERLLGVPTSASQRASDMAAKVWATRKNGGRVVFATGTPVTNSLVENFTLMRYLQPDVLEAMRCTHFDQWKAQFTRVKRSLEPDPGGSGYREVSRLAEVVNVPELVQALALVTDAVNENNSMVERPTPEFDTIVSEPSQLQQLYREVLAERVQKLKSQSRGEQGEDNILVILGEARRSALDLRTLFPDLPGGEIPGNKIRMLASEIVSTYREHDTAKGTQAVFLDFATPGRNAWNGYAELKEKLVAQGIPETEIAFIHDVKSDQAKGELFAKVRSGDVRVIVGSTEKMGEGTNIQDRLVRLHHVNAPFHPGHMIQRNGRIIRQGNRNKDVKVSTYVTRGLLEDWNWHLVTTKESFIRQVFDGLAAHTNGAGLARRITDDVMANMDYGVIEAAASDNPLVKERCRLESAIKQMELERDGFAARNAGFRRKAVSIDNDLDYRERLRIKLEKSIAGLLPAPEKFGLEIKVDGAFQLVEGHGKAGKALAGVIAKAKEGMFMRETEVARFRGLSLYSVRSVSGDYLLEIGPADGDRNERVITMDMGNDELGLVRRIENKVQALPGRLASVLAAMESLRKDRAGIVKELDGEWPLVAELQQAVSESARIGAQLAESNKAVEHEESAIVRFASILREYDAADNYSAHINLDTNAAAGTASAVMMLDDDEMVEDDDQEYRAAASRAPSY